MSHSGEVPATTKQIHSFTEELDALNKENGEISAQYSELASRVGRAEQKATVYREVLADLCIHLKAVLDLERQF